MNPGKKILRRVSKLESGAGKDISQNIQSKDGLISRKIFGLFFITDHFIRNVLASTQKSKKLLPVENYTTEKKLAFYKKIRIFWHFVRAFGS